MKQNQKPCIITKKVINMGKRSTTLSEVKLIENISKNMQIQGFKERFSFNKIGTKASNICKAKF